MTFGFLIRKSKWENSMRICVIEGQSPFVLSFKCCFVGNRCLSTSITLLDLLISDTYVGGNPVLLVALFEYGMEQTSHSTIKFLLSTFSLPVATSLPFPFRS